LQVNGAAHDPQVIVPPQPSLCVPQVCPPVHAVLGTHMHVLVELLQLCPAGQVPQSIAGHPGGVNVPHTRPAGQVVGQLVWQWPAASQN
jgi:hypothetical protein